MKEIIDWNKFLKNMGGDENFCREILKECLITIPEGIEKIKSSLRNGFIEEGIIAAHTMKGNFANIETENLREIAFKIENLIKEKDIEKIPVMLEILEKEFQKFEKLMKTFLGEK